MESQRRRVTISDVAKAAGVSVAAASYALSGRPGVSDASRARILAAADAISFRPNLVARSLRKGKAPVIGLLLADIANPYYPEIASGVITGAASKDYQVFLAHTGLRGEVHDTAVTALLEHQCSGLIFTSAVEEVRSIFDELLRLGLPFVQAVRRLESLPADFVGIDDRSAARELAGHVLAQGRTRPAILNGPAASSASQDRLTGFRDAMKNRSIELLYSELVDGELTRESGASRTELLLEGGGGLPDVLICGNDMIALGALDALARRGLRVPEDIAVVGYDDMSFASSHPLQLTTVEVPRHDMGRAAAELLFERIYDPTLPPRTVILPHRLMVRRTCGSSL